MTPTDAMVDQVARAARRYYYRMYGAPYIYAVCDSELGWDAPPIVTNLSATDAANIAAMMNAHVVISAYESALQEAGLVVVPREPTEEMQIKGLEALIPNLKEAENHVEKLIGDDHKWPWMTVGISLGNSNVTDAVYRAMLSAASPAPKDTKQE